MRNVFIAIMGLVIGAVVMNGVVEASRTSSAGSGVLVAQAEVKTVPPFEGASPAPSDALANPVDDPIEAYSDLKGAKKQGWAVFLLACVVMLAAGLARAADKWPTVKPLAWIKANKWALLITSGAGLVAAAAYNALALGGSPYAAVLAAAGAVLTLIAPKAAQ